MAEAAKLANCSLLDVSRAMRDGHLQWKRYRSSEPGTTVKGLRD
jgi:hypothetical protein